MWCQRRARARTMDSLTQRATAYGFRDIAFYAISRVCRRTIWINGWTPPPRAIAGASGVAARAKVPLHRTKKTSHIGTACCIVRAPDSWNVRAYRISHRCGLIGARRQSSRAPAHLICAPYTRYISGSSVPSKGLYTYSSLERIYTVLKERDILLFVITISWARACTMVRPYHIHIV